MDDKKREKRETRNSKSETAITTFKRTSHSVTLNKTKCDVSVEKKTLGTFYFSEIYFMQTPRTLNKLK